MFPLGSDVATLHSVTELTTLRDHQRVRRATGRRTLLLALTAAVPLAWAAPALADPVYPSQGDVDAAKAAADAAAGEVSTLQVELARRQSDLEAAQTALSVATEDYDEARAVLAQRTDEATAAAAAARAAELEADRTRTELGRLAASRYRGSAGDLGPLVTVLGSTSAQDLLDRSATMDHLAVRRDEVAQEAAAARVWARTTSARAETARADQQTATDATAAAQRTAQAAAATADALVASTRGRTEEVLARLAVLRQSSVDLERRRQDGLEAERRAREEAAARAAQEAATAAAARDAAAAAARAASSSAASSRAGSSGAGSGAGAARRQETVRVATGSSAGADGAVAWALAQRGKPYLWAADGPDSFDCSGLVLRAWESAGVSLPHSSRLQYSGEAKVAIADLQAGDLVFYATDTSVASTIHHVGMFIGNGQMVEAPHSGALVRTASIYRSGLMTHGTRPA